MYKVIYVYLHISAYIHFYLNFVIRLSIYLFVCLSVYHTNLSYLIDPSLYFEALILFVLSVFYSM